MSVLIQRKLLVAAAACLWAGATPLVLAQASYPNQPIKLIVPFPPAGGTDTVARLLVEKITTTGGWTFVIDNRPGAGGNIGLDAVAKSKPDGYTIGMGQTANLAINPTLYPKMPYNALADFVPVALVAGQPLVLVVKAESPYRSLSDMVAAAKAKPASLSMASAGSGTVGHLAGELFAQRAGVRFLHVPYKGAAPAATDLMGDKWTSSLRRRRPRSRWSRAASCGPWRSRRPSGSRCCRTFPRSRKAATRASKRPTGRRWSRRQAHRAMWSSA